MSTVTSGVLITSFASVLAESFWALMTLFRMSFSVIMPMGFLSSATMTAPTSFSTIIFAVLETESEGRTVGAGDLTIDSSVISDNSQALFHMSFSMSLILSTYLQSLE